MTICNMSIEGGRPGRHDRPRRDDLRVPRGPPPRPEGRRLGRSRRVLADTAHRPGCHLRRRESTLDASDTRTPRLVGHQPRPDDPGHRHRSRRPSDVRGPDRPGLGRYVRSSTWTSTPGPRSPTITIDRVFLGSCTNARIEDLRAAAAIVDGKKVAPNVSAMVVSRLGTGESSRPRRRDSTRIFIEAGFEWRDAGCSMCLAMNPDILAPGRTLRLDLEPQLRGPPGRRRSHPSRQPRRWLQPQPSPAISSTSGRYR